VFILKLITESRYRKTNKLEKGCNRDNEIAISFILALSDLEMNFNDWAIFHVFGLSDLLILFTVWQMEVLSEICNDFQIQFS
jgi:hypothetical protein